MFSRVVVLVGLLLGCTVAEGAVPARPLMMTASVMAAGDTAKLYVSWSAANRANGYRVTATVSTTNGTWTGLPTDSLTPGLSSVIAAVSASADSARFTVCVKSTNGVTTSLTATCSAPAKWLRKLQPPGSVQIDSITLGLAPVASLQVTPSSATIVIER